MIATEVSNGEEDDNDSSNEQISLKEGASVTSIIENPTTSKSTDQRNEFGSNLEALVSVIASAVGLGNVWRFPYVCYKNGGGAFFIPYLTILITAAMPIMAMEMALGQFTSLGPLGSWNCYPLLGGVGLSTVFCSWMMMIYYAVLAAYALFYIAMSLYSLKDYNNPIWNGCNNSWNTKNCLNFDKLVNYHERNVSVLMSDYQRYLPTSEFWYIFASEDDGSIRRFGPPNWKMVIALFATWAIALATLFSGVKSMGKANYFFVFFPYICIIFLVCGSLFKEGAAEGILVYLVPKFEKLLEVQVWADAGQQIFFSLGLSQGVLVTLSSFNGYHEQCLRNTLIVVIVNCFTSFWVGFPIFAVLSHMAFRLGIPVDEVINSGPGLAFVAYPQALNLLPGSAVWSIIFFTMLFSVALGTVNTYTETCLCLFIDAFPALRKKKSEIAFRSGFIIILFLLGLPMICGGGGMQLLNLADSYCIGISSFIIAISMCLTLGWFYGMKNFGRDVAMMIGYRPNWYWRMTWRFSCVFVVLLLSILWLVDKTTKHTSEPYWANSLGWAISMSVVVIIPVYAFNAMCQHPSGFGCESYRALTKPNDKWGPARDEDRIGRYQKTQVL